MLGRDTVDITGVTATVPPDSPRRGGFVMSKSLWSNELVPYAVNREVGRSSPLRDYDLWAFNKELSKFTVPCVLTWQWKHSYFSEIPEAH